MKKELHPLAAWLERRKTSVYRFKEETGLPFFSLYQHIQGKGDPKLSTMLAIEEKTGQAVTAEKQVKWWRKRL